MMLKRKSQVGWAGFFAHRLQLNNCTESGVH